MSAAVLAASPATQRMLRAPVLPTLLSLALPNVLGLLANTVVIGFDGYIVGRLGADTLAGVAVVLPLAMLMLQMSAGALGGSTTAVVARALGAGDAAQATRLARHALLLGLAVSLPFTLLADTDHAVAEAYGVWGLKKYMGREYMGVDRTTFVIGPDGVVAKVFEKVKPATHADDVLAALAG